MSLLAPFFARFLDPLFDSFFDSFFDLFFDPLIARCAALSVHPAGIGSTASNAVLQQVFGARYRPVPHAGIVPANRRKSW
jgi:hypothetical protein